ncbi:uncharacterized protein LOC124260368 [Haliotis rubra]|uniref:uncharacterized protein LOC124260368 n=1 Tax=Haliotis rubra TaxID=36100 RepID=UPI001EE58CB1|nr:uncharacterized protein LOC124260368 [Haliotis rubra]
MLCWQSVQQQPRLRCRQRLLNANAITSCDEFPGLVSIVAPQAANITVCTGVITSATTLSLPANCALFANGANVIAQDGTVVASDLQVPAPATIGGPITVTLDTPIDAGSCPGVACVYTAAMADVIVLDQCQVAAGGYSSNTDLSGGSSFEYLDIPSLQPTDQCLAFIQVSSQNIFFGDSQTYNCFFSPTGSTCQGDMGAPIVCPLTTGEQVVIGQVENSECTPGSVVGFYNLEEASVRVVQVG